MGIKLSEVDFTYSKNKKSINYVNHNINISINGKDEFVAIVGHTGSGKSTLVQLFNGLLLPSSGIIDVSFRNNGEMCYYKIKGGLKKCKFALSKDEFKNKIRYKNKIYLKPLRSHIGLVFQFPEYQIFEETVLKDIMFGPKNFKKDSKEAEKKAREAARIMGIENLLDKSPFSLSGGQMRKVAIAGILAMEPEVLVLDEPTVGLDPSAKSDLLDFLVDLQNNTHKSIILITHDMDVVGKYAKRVIVLNKGVIKYDGSKEELFKHEDIILDNDLGYPNIVDVLRGLRDKFNIDIDIYQYNVEDAFLEIKKKMGDKHE